MSQSCSLQSRRLLFITGKGGVGKTTVMAVYALAFASQKKRVLCAMCQAKDRLSTLFGVPPIGSEMMPVHTNIEAVNIHPEAALREYGRMVLRVKALHRAVFDNRLVTSFFRATPGLYSWAMLGKAWYHSTEKLPRQTEKRYDVVLLDAPSTGHGLEMLFGPKVIVDVAPSGLLRKEAVKAWNMFSDETKFGVILVTLPEEMPVTETIELYDVLRHDLRLPVAQIVVNRFIPPLFSAQQRSALSKLSNAASTSSHQHDSVDVCNSDTYNCTGIASDAMWLPAVYRAKREIVQSQAVQRLERHVTSPLLYLPHRFDGVNSLQDIEQFAAMLVNQQIGKPISVDRVPAQCGYG